MRQVGRIVGEGISKSYRLSRRLHRGWRDDRRGLPPDGAEPAGRCRTRGAGTSSALGARDAAGRCGASGTGSRLPHGSARSPSWCTRPIEFRRGGAWSVVTRSLEQRPELLLAADGDGYRVAGDSDDIAGRINVGPSDVGGFVRFSPSPDHTPVGRVHGATRGGGLRDRRPRAGYGLGTAAAGAQRR